MSNIILVGYGGHAKSVADCIEQDERQHIIGYTDIDKREDAKYPYLGTDDVLQEYLIKGVRHAVLGIGFMGNSNVREQIYDKAKWIGFNFSIVIDSSAVVASSTVIEEGVFIGKRAVVNSEAKVGKNCIINTGAMIEHEVQIDSYAHIAVGAVLCGGVHVGDHCFIGANATVIQGIEIGRNTIIGAGAVVTKNIPENCVAVGVPAQVIKIGS